jgi:hypothetical protein
MGLGTMVGKVVGIISLLMGTGSLLGLVLGAGSLKDVKSTLHFLMETMLLKSLSTVYSLLVLKEYLI